ncbi:hypothetical protein N0V90_007798 [Kalmusia sp. IMI 367209]|nr:hypothetical protein N0V90_007798 [Kalmusia sp. IMI 367209]
MAEVAAGAGIALAAEEVLSTTLQAGVATYFLTKPTQPLSATFTRIAVAHDDELHKRSLMRSNHTLTIVDSKAYIFGGETADGEIASNDMHVVNLKAEENKEPEYQLIPAIAENDVQGGKVPRGRTKHAACAFQGGVVVYAGMSSVSGEPVDQGEIWHFNPEERTWATFSALSNSANEQRFNPENEVRIFPYSDSLVILTGTETEGTTTIQRCMPNSTSDSQIILPHPPTSASPSNASVHDGHLYLISTSDPMSSQLYILPLDTKEGEPAPKWTTLTFPTNPLVPGPRARHAGALLPISTGYGRNYLIYLLGARSEPPSSTANTTTSKFIEQDLRSPTSDKIQPEQEKAEQEKPTQWSDTWTLQLPSSNLDPQAKLNIKDAIKPAKIKDAIRAASAPIRGGGAGLKSKCACRMI